MEKVKYFLDDKCVWIEESKAYFVVNEYGTKVYRNKKGYWHNKIGPALIYNNGHKAYYINGKKHNENGPAMVWKDGHKEYYIKGKKLSEKEFLQWRRNKNLKHNLDLLCKK